MKVRVYEGNDAAKWDGFVKARPDSNCYHLIGWKKIIEESFGHKTFYLLAENDDGGITGVLPLVHLKSVLFGNFMVSMPYFNYGGICSDSGESYSILIRDAIKIAKDVGAGHIEFREVRPLDNGLQRKEAKVSMKLEFPESADLLMKGMSSKLRSQIKRPEREGFYSRVGREEELDGFYDVFSVNMRDLGTPVYSKKFFYNILKTFPDSSWISSVYSKDHKAVASGFLIGFRDTIEIPWASSLKAYNSYSPNMLMYWSSLKFGCDSGFKFFDFGRSTPGEGTYRFKEQWGARPFQLYWYYWVSDGKAMPELNPKNPKYSAAINIWKKLPVGLTKLIGPSVVKNLP